MLWYTLPPPDQTNSRPNIVPLVENVLQTGTFE